ncbi:polyphosphate:AMP phosphotransferase [Geomesophilobacter sediminis]|uniref:Polyphosphate:AMP phosphotransferase n=1 Tax=Geomesophilobacter sediminis TaxID=2798584 RepID=A0A8J7S9P2_9BACT|nr:polyphosphate:AMP phosphotransferase [Geomesophilobacter sediminis]MBJ6726996.1 polyphosphate:AMP phosphotransferase [Geomesophilobacter sediminis]
MFESAELGHKIDNATYKRELPPLREALLDAQYDLLDTRKFPLIILMAGVDMAGKGETVNLLNEWLDPRHIETHALRDLTDEELQRPPMWRYWRVLPPRGKIGIFIGSWYSSPLLENVYGSIGNAELDQRLERINRFEKILCDEGALILKFWLHLSADQQKKRLKALEKDPDTRWRVTEKDRRHLKLYDRFHQVSERMLRVTSSPRAPWFIVDGSDPNYRSLTIGKVILQALRERLDAPPPAPEASFPPVTTAIDGRTVLKSLQLDQKLSKADYKKELEHWQGKLNLLSRHPDFKKISLLVVFEGNDAAGKGGAIRRVTQALDARQYRSNPVAAPSEEERLQPWLWRFWRRLPPRGTFAIFDRSWYGRVLVERVEGYCSPADWMRAYGEINDFEEQLERHHFLVVKFWLAISKEEQLRRFEERERVAFKRFKITEEDWRNRDKWDEYEAAICDMIDRTSAEITPWVLVEANNKYFARIKVLKSLCRSVEQALKSVAADGPTKGVVVKPERRKEVKAVPAKLKKANGGKEKKGK